MPPDLLPFSYHTLSISFGSAFVGQLVRHLLLIHAQLRNYLGLGQESIIDLEQLLHIGGSEGEIFGLLAILSCGFDILERLENPIEFEINNIAHQQIKDFFAALDSTLLADSFGDPWGKQGQQWFSISSFDEQSLNDPV